MNALIPAWKKWLSIGLEEDQASFDWTARAAAKAQGPHSDHASHANLIAKADGIWAANDGLAALELLSREMGSFIEVESFFEDGFHVKTGQKICTWTGTAEAIVVFERSFINLASYACGIATQTNNIVQRVIAKNMNHPVRITGTRKTLPGYREIVIQSTLFGGAHPHRYNLSGGLLLKENHIAASGSIQKAISNAREIIPHLLKIEIEVRNLKELKEAIQSGAEIIMLDNFTPPQIKEAITLKPKNVIYEVSGGINESNIDSYLIEGLDVISVGSITHSVKALDLSLLIHHFTS